MNFELNNECPHTMGSINYKLQYDDVQNIDILNIASKKRFYCMINDDLRLCIKRNLENMNEKRVLKKANISRQTLKRILYKNNYWLNIETLFTLSNIFKIKKQLIKKNILSIKTKNSKPIKNFEIKISNELCRLIGHLLSDGGIHIIEKEGKYRIFYVNNEKILLDSFTEDTKKIFGDIEIYFREREERGDEIWLPSTVGLILYNLFDFFDCKIRRVPNLIFKLKQENICNFLQAVFDDEGYLYPDKKMIVLSLVNKKLLSDIKKLLGIVGIKTNPIHIHDSKNRSKMFYFNLTNRTNIENFNKKIGFIHPKKCEKLDILISSYGA